MRNKQAIVHLEQEEVEEVMNESDTRARNQSPMRRLALSDILLGVSEITRCVGPVDSCCCCFWLLFLRAIAVFLFSSCRRCL